MEKVARKNKLRYLLLKKLPKSVIKFIVKIKGTGVLLRPKLTESVNTKSLKCTIAYNNYGAFCTPDSCLEDEPVQFIYRGEQYEEESILYIQSLNIPGDIIHAGTYFGDTLPGLSKSINPDSKIWAFEPNQESFRCAQITILLNQLDNVELANLGIGDKDEKLHLLYTDTGNMTPMGGTSRLVEEAGDNTQTVRVKKLDDIIPGDRTISVIHLDVEGFEDKVLNGAKNILYKDKPIIITEMTKGKTEMFMKELGYVFHKGLEEKQWEHSFRNAVFVHEDTITN